MYGLASNEFEFEASMKEGMNETHVVAGSDADAFVF